MRRARALIFVAAAACAGEDEPQAPSLEASLGGTSMRDTPWPCDVFLRDGTIHVDAIPLEGQPTALASLAASLSELDGAPSYGSAFFPVTGGPIATGPLEGVARWIDLDDPAARVVEGRLFHRAETGELVALAPPGHVLAQGHRHAVVVESPRVRPSAAMRAALEGGGPPAMAHPGLGARLAGRDVGALTVFTVGRPTRLVEQMREVAAARPAPTARVASVLTGAALDDLLGRPTTTRPGLGDPDGVVHDAIEAIVLGSFDVPSFLTDAPPKLGRVERDASGAPRVKGAAPAHFMLALPRRPGGFANVPVLIFQHGLNAGRTQVAAVANDYARAGYATIGIDALWHGSRAPSARDEVHNFTGAPGPDGLADADDFGAALALFDFAGDPAQGIAPFDGRYVRDNFRQAIVELTELVRFVREGDVSAIAAADPSLSGLSFDASALVYTGESFGSIVGASALAVAPELPAAVLSVGGGGIFLPTFASSPLFSGLVTPFLRTSFDASLDVSDPAALPAEAQRSLSLVQAAISPGDPLSFAPLLAERSKHLLLLVARSDELIPNQSSELLAVAARATAVTLPSGTEPPRFAALPSAAAPWQAEGDASTIAFVQLAPALHTMFTAHAGERRYEPEFPPFVALGAPEEVENPIERAHGLALGFARSLREGRPRVEASP